MNFKDTKVIERVAKDLKYNKPLDEHDKECIEYILQHFSTAKPDYFYYYNRHVLSNELQKDIAKELGVSSTTISSRITKSRRYLLHYIDVFNSKNKDIISDVTKTNDTLESLGIKLKIIKELNKHNIYDKAQLLEFIQLVGPSWNSYLGFSDNTGRKLEVILDIDYSTYYESLKPYVSQIFKDIGFGDKYTERNIDMLLIVIEYYKDKYPFYFDSYYKYLTDFSWADTIDRYNKPKLNVWNMYHHFVKNIRKPEMQLLIYKGISKDESTRNYKLWYMANKVDYNINLIREDYSANTSLISIPLTNRSRNILLSLGCTTYGHARAVIQNMGPRWYKELNSYFMFNVKEIEFYLNISNGRESLC